jgi:heterodisulfide reductase subunit B
MNTTYAYFPGCSLHSTAAEYDASVKKVCEKVGIKLEEMKNWVCCGATPVHAVNPKLALALSAKNISIASQMGMDIALSCAACFNRMKSTAKHLDENEQDRKQISEVIETEYKSGTGIYHIISILSKLDPEILEKAITRKLTGLKVGCYYGCLLVRPPKVTEFDDAENPTIMEKLLAHTGADVVDWNFRTECCGAALSVPRTDVVLKLSNDIFADAKKRGIDVLAVACPLCQMNLDMRQWEVEKKYQTTYQIPIMYFSQILGFAMGASKDELGFNKLIVSPNKIFFDKHLV